MQKAQELAAKVNSQPSLREFQALAEEFKAFSGFYGRPSSGTLEVYAAILQSQLVLVFQNEKSGLQTLVELFSTPTGLGCLTSRLNLGPYAETGAIIGLLERILKPDGAVSRLLEMDKPEVSNLVFGSRILAAASAKPGEQTWLGDMSAYSRWLADQMIGSQSVDPKLFERALKLGAPQVYINEYISKSTSLVFLSNIFKQLRSSQQRFAVTHALVQLLPRNPNQSGRLLADLAIDPELFADVCMRLPGDVLMVRASVLLARHAHKLATIAETIGREWASKTTIERRSLVQQQTMTQFLIAACVSFDASTARKFAHSSVLTSGVSNHLASTSTSIRNLGTLVAEVFAKQAGAKLEFGIQYNDYDWWIGEDKMDDTYVVVTDSGYSGDDTDNHEEKISEQATTPLTSILNPPRQVDSDDEEEDLYGEDAESDEEVMPLFYVKDLITYLRSDKYGEVQCALNTGASLINRKASFGSEVRHYEEEVLRTACGLTDKFSITDFSELRQSILNAVVSADPQEAAPIVVKLFVTGDWSLAQRQCLLASLVYGAHTLAQGGAVAQHEQLPGILHKMFISPKDRIYKELLSSPTPTSLAAPSIEGGHGSGKHQVVTRRSKRLDTPKQDQPKNLFSDVSARFFFPLFAAQPPLRQSSYDAIVYAQWLRTLGVVAAEAYPSRHIPNMVSELWPVLKTLVISIDHHEIIIQEAIYSCLIMLISVAAGIVLQDYPADIGIMFDAIARSASRAPGPDAQKSSRTALAALADLAQQVEQRVLGQ